ncbi:FMN-dependent NADH-azoreductase [Parahaliea maris]|uniref:FMN dependent NADH:quinone oxidoreductase n=1 Tax=Parahaliea maris TaxID=2716870 RepID=A0A5C8ZLY7_9GAMM|nr:NAD(P)H-dependent oxidoreductase [Parahaliea maris]TXS89493.1 FMN-dependent NADH-azoreductase [Parahaliea maris]
MKILSIEASPRGDKSNSSRVAQAFLEACTEANPDVEIDRLNVFDDGLPAFGREGASQKMAHIARLMESGQGLEAAGEWSGVLDHIQRLKSADKVVISSAMWNFSIPYPLKHYIDLVCQPGLTFGVNPQGEYVGMLKGKSLQLILSRGSEYRPGFPRQEDGIKTDYQSAYLRHIAAFLGFEDVREIILQPMDAKGPAHAATVLEQALQAARAAGAAF